VKALRLAGHPLHPMLVHFPIALWTLAVVATPVGCSRTMPGGGSV